MSINCACEIVQDMHCILDNNIPSFHPSYMVCLLCMGHGNVSNLCVLLAGLRSTTFWRNYLG